MTFLSNFRKSILQKDPFALYREEITQAVVLNWESRHRFTVLIKGLEEKYQPSGFTEYHYIQRMAHARWWQMRFWHPDQPIDISRRPNAASFRTMEPPFHISEGMLRLEKTMNRRFNRAITSLRKYRESRQL